LISESHSAIIKRFQTVKTYRIQAIEAQRLFFIFIQFFKAVLSDPAKQRAVKMHSFMPGVTTKNIVMVTMSFTR
jgi:hypothetical protein